MFCRMCGNELRNNEQTCPVCGAPTGETGTSEWGNNSWGNSSSQSDPSMYGNGGYSSTPQGQSTYGNGGYPSMQQEQSMYGNGGYGPAGTDYGSYPDNGYPDQNASNTGKKSNKKKKLIIIISVAATALIAAGIILFFVLRTTGGYSTPEEAVKAIDDAYHANNYEECLRNNISKTEAEALMNSSNTQIRKVYSDANVGNYNQFVDWAVKEGTSGIQLITDKIKNNTTMNDLEISISYGGYQKYNPSTLAMNDFEDVIDSAEESMDFTRLGNYIWPMCYILVEAGDLDHISDAEGERLLNEFQYSSFYKSCDEFGYQNVSIHMTYKKKSGKEKSETLLFPVPVYKVSGRWYVPAGSLVTAYDMSIKAALDRYEIKSKKADDVTAAGAINSAMNASLANEDVYDECMGIIDRYGQLKVNEFSGKTESEVILVRIYPNGEYSSYTGADIPKTIKELQGNISGNPQIKYLEEGADHWLVGISDYRPVVYLTNKNETVRWMLQPWIHDDYK